MIGTADLTGRLPGTPPPVRQGSVTAPADALGDRPPATDGDGPGGGIDGGTGVASDPSTPEPVTISTVAPDPALQISQDPIPFPQSRIDQMAAYSQRHYGIDSAVLDPRAIVLHFTESDTWTSARDTFASNATNLGEKPGTCAHFVIDQQGGIHQLVPLEVQCRHTIGLNHVAIGIEFVQNSRGRGAHWADQQILARPAQLAAGLALVRSLQARYAIATADVIGHAEANSSPLFQERLGWRNDHTDWLTADAAQFRAQL